MPIIPIGFAQVTHFFSGTGAPTGAACTYGIGLDFSVTVDVLAGTLEAAFVAEIMPELGNDVTLVRTLVKAGPNLTGPSAESTSNVDGGAAVEGTSPNTAFLVRKFTSLGGRRFRGRMFLPGVGENNIDNSGFIATLKLGELNTAVEAWRDAVNVVLGVTTMFLLHQDLLDDEGDPIPGSAEDPTQIILLTVDGLVATQRRRLRR